MPLVDPLPIETTRLRIRAVTRDDLPALLEVNRDEDVNRFLPYPRWTTLADADAWFGRMAALKSTGTAVQLVVADRDRDEAIGSCLVFRFDEGSARAELGYVLGRAHWGRGVMHEALAALVRCAFTEMSLRRLEAEVHPDNLASSRLLARLGFRREGLLRQRWVAKGVAHDVEIHGLLRSDALAPSTPARVDR